MGQKEGLDKESSSPFTDKGYGITIEVINSQNLSINERWGTTSHVSELSRKIFFGLFDLVAGECLKDNYTENTENNFDNILGVLFKNFNLDNIDEQGSLEASVKDYIQKLAEYNYFLPNDLVELVRDKSNLKSLEFDIGYKGDLDSVLKTIRDVLISLREEKIEFWNKVFEKYKEDKEAYDLEFRTKQTRRKKDLDSFSKIDIDDYIKRFEKK